MPATLDLPLAAVTEVLAPRNQIHWIDTAVALRTLSHELQRAEVLGLAVETALDLGTLCLVQVAIEGHTYLIDPFAVADLSPLGSVLEWDQTVKVIHNARLEQRVLAAAGLALTCVFDTMEGFKRLRGNDASGGHSLATICERELGASIDKSQQTSNWSRRPLDPEQLRYAALDAEVLFGVVREAQRPAECGWSGRRPERQGGMTATMRSLQERQRATTARLPLDAKRKRTWQRGIESWYVDGKSPSIRRTPPGSASLASDRT